MTKRSMVNAGTDPRHHLTAAEEREWRELKREPNTYEDWEDLNATITAYKRRYIARHRKPKVSHSDNADAARP